MLILFSSFGSLCAQDWAQLHYYKEANAVIGNAEPHENRIVFMGNSIIEGWEQQNLPMFKRANYINRGIGGQTTGQMKVRFYQDVIQLQPKVVVILAGINDIAQNQGYVPIDEIAKNIYDMAVLAKAYGIQVVMCSTLPANNFPWRLHIKPADQIIELNRLLKEYAIEHEHYYLDYYSAMVNDEKGMQKELTYDGVHCNLEGYKVMEPMVMALLQEIL